MKYWTTTNFRVLTAIVYIFRYRLTGSLPSDMGSNETGLPNLRFLSLQRNALTGQLPSTWGSLHCHVVSASGGDNTQPDPSVAAGAQVGCLFWLLGNNFSGLCLRCCYYQDCTASITFVCHGYRNSGTVPMDWCGATWNEMYIGDCSAPGTPDYGNCALSCNRPCISTAYAVWPTCKNGSAAHCTPCP